MKTNFLWHMTCYDKHRVFLELNYIHSIVACCQKSKEHRLYMHYIACFGGRDICLITFFFFLDLEKLIQSEEELNHSLGDSSCASDGRDDTQESNVMSV